MTAIARAVTGKTSSRSPRAGSMVRLNPALRVLWRGNDQVQLELGSQRIMIENVSSEQIAALLNGVNSGVDVGPSASISELSNQLAELGLLLPTEDPDAPPETKTGRTGHRTPDFAALTARFGVRADAVLNDRRAACVRIHGTSRLSVLIAATLAASGVGIIELASGGQVYAGDACPGGVSPADEGKRFLAAAIEAIRRAAPDVEVGPISGYRIADLAILTDPGPVDTVIRKDLHLRKQAHLIASVDCEGSIVGPLVLPGFTSCLRCADLQRCDRDPAWPLLAVQLSNQTRHRAAADVALCVATAGFAASQTLAHLEHSATTTIGGTVEWQLPDWRSRRRSWPVHADCDCGAPPSKR